MKILLLAALAALSACSTLGRHDAPGCSGPRRAANPAGSVLAPNTPTPPTPPSAPGCAAR
jgi:hypothetical protein